MDFPFEQEVKEGVIYRTFKPDVESEELKWHQDLNDRKVTIIENGGWKFQMENGLPTKLKDGDILDIPKLAWHRVIKGENQLVVSIIE